jgi:predicted phosphoribosyltransferase
MRHVGSIVSSPYEAFQDRREAGRELVRFMGAGPTEGAIVLAVPRGGVEVGLPVAEALEAELALVFVRKLPIPDSPEAGFGAVALDGSTSINDGLVREVGISDDEIEKIKAEVLEEVRRRAREYAGTAEPPEVEGRAVFLVDDGLASGYTMVAAAKMVARGQPRSMTLAVPVSPVGSLSTVEKYFGESYCLIAQNGMSFAVASYYRDFRDLSDREVRSALGRASGRGREKS